MLHSISTFNRIKLKLDFVRRVVGIVHHLDLMYSASYTFSLFSLVVFIIYVVMCRSGFVECALITHRTNNDVSQRARAPMMNAKFN